jgi:hypothetical protein
MRSVELLMVDDEVMEVLKYCMQLLKIIEDRYGEILKAEEAEDDILIEAIKKLTIFTRSMTRIKHSGPRLLRYYSLF